jgi:O-antigen ligase
VTGDVTFTFESPAEIAAPDRPHHGRRDLLAPVTLLRLYVVLLVLIRPTLIIGHLGAIGTPATVVGWGALVLWGVAVFSPGDQLRRSVVPLRVTLGFLVGTTLAAYAVLHARPVPILELLSSDRMILEVLSWAGVALFAAECLGGRDDIYRVLRTLVFSVAVMAIVGMLQFYFGVNLADLPSLIPLLQENIDLESVLDREGFRRPSGTATHPIEYGCVLAMTLPFGLHLARFDLARTRLRRWLPLGLIAMGIPVAVSRSAILGSAVAMGVVILGLDAKLRPRVLGAMAAFVVFVYATTPGLLGTIRNLFLLAGADSSITTRTSDYELVAEHLRQAPLLGRGPGTYLPPPQLILDNQYLMSLIEVGLVGFVAVIGYLLTTAFLGRGARHTSTDARIRDLGQALAAAGLTATVTAFTFDGFSFLMYAGLIPALLGLAGALWGVERAGVPGAARAPTVKVGAGT